MNTKVNLTWRELILVASTLFGLFFGAGNIIFPVLMGQMAGANALPAALGFVVTAVGLPLLGIIAMGLSHSEGLIAMSAKVSKGYSYFFTVALYLTIGPFFAIPRTATVSYEVAFASYVPAAYESLALFVYSVLFFAAAYYFAMRPSNILVWIGKFLNPLFLVVLAVILSRAFAGLEAPLSEMPISSVYQQKSFFQGFLEGYNTMDALASLAFGIIVIRSIRGLGVTEPRRIAHDTVQSGLLTTVLMALIYFGLTILGAQSRDFMPIADNGGVALAAITHHYFGTFGAILLATVMAVACLKTALGLVIACADTFYELFPDKLLLKKWTGLFTIFAFMVANVGLNTIIVYSIPMLMFLYPLAITLILLHLMEPIVKSKHLYQSVTAFTLVAAVFDMVKVMPEPLYSLINADAIVDLGSQVLPFYQIGFGWLMPAFVGLIFGLVRMKIKT